MVEDVRRTRIGDVVLATGLMVFSLIAAAVTSAWREPTRPADLPAYLLIVLACAVLAVRRRFPVPVLVVSSLAVSCFLLLGYPYGPVMLSLAVAVYTVARRVRTGRALWLSVLAYALLVAHVFVNPEALPGLLGLIPAAAWIGIPTTVGISRRLVLEARARERAETERRLRDEERLWVAHEVHDVVGHGLAAIQMQADIALHVARTKPDQAVAALTAISAASAAALAELRDALASVAPEGEGAQRAPAASLTRLDALCDRIRATGVEVLVRSTGTPRVLPSAIDLAAYRVVQESLTNVVKHAVSPRATVELHYSSDELTLTISSPHDGTAIREGFGLRGIRRRVTSLGGSLSVRAGETMQLRVVFPLPGAPENAGRGQA